MSELIQLGGAASQPVFSRPAKPTTAVLLLQGVTLAWMLVELGVSVYATVTARSPAMMAFGSDSLVELLSAVVVLLQWTPKMTISERKAHRAAAVLLFVLAIVVGLIALGSLVFHLQPDTRRAAIGITIAALFAMPVLAILKRRESRQSQNAALAADAVQSAACAYIALVTLAGLALSAAFHIPWFDSLAALLAIPILMVEGKSAWKGQGCTCC